MKKSAVVLAFGGVLSCLACGGPESKLAGIVLDGISGEPVVGVKVVAGTSTDIVEEKKFAVIETKTGADGRFVISSKLANREFEVEMTKEDYTTVATKMLSPAFEQTREVDATRMYRFPDVSGTVVSWLTGNPLANCSVECAGKTTQTDAEGRFSFSLVPPGSQPIKATCGDQVRTTTVSVSTTTDLEEMESLEVSSIPESDARMWYMSGEAAVPIDSDYQFSKYFQSLYLTNQQCVVTSLNSDQGIVRGDDFNPVLKKAPVLRSGSILLAYSDDLVAAPVYYSSTTHQVGRHVLKGNTYFIATVGMEPFALRSSYNPPDHISWFFKRGVVLLNTQKTVHVDAGRLTMYELDLSPGIYCLGRTIDRYWSRKSGCVVVRIE